MRVGTSLEEAVVGFPVAPDPLCSGQGCITNPPAHLSIRGHQGHEGGISTVGWVAALPHYPHFIMELMKAAPGAAREPSSSESPALGTQQSWQQQVERNKSTWAQSNVQKLAHTMRKSGRQGTAGGGQHSTPPQPSKRHLYLCACGHDPSTPPSR